MSAYFPPSHIDAQMDSQTPRQRTRYEDDPYWDAVAVRSAIANSCSSCGCGVEVFPASNQKGKRILLDSQPHDDGRYAVYLDSFDKLRATLKLDPTGGLRYRYHECRGAACAWTT